MRRPVSIIMFILIYTSLLMISCGDGDGAGDFGTVGLSLGDKIIGSTQPARQYDGLPNDPTLPAQGDIRTAWSIETGDPTVVVAVLDTGIDWYHEDLRESIWVNAGEDINGNNIAEESDLDGLDNDGNGYVDDIIGWDFVHNDNNPMDSNGHGTSVSGVISATANNGTGIVGYTWNCPVMPIRVRSTLATDYAIVAKGVQYAIENGAKVINLSLGGPQVPGDVFKNIIEAAYENGILIIGSAGNQAHSDTHYPDAYPQVMSVAAVDGNGRRLSYSNYGPHVEICAQTGRLTTRLGGGYIRGGGTSHSTPCVAALGALLFSHFPHLSNDEVREIIKLTADPVFDPMYGGLLGSGRINYFKALNSEW